MVSSNKIKKSFLHKNTPIIILFISVLNEFDFNNLGLNISHLILLTF